MPSAKVGATVPLMFFTDLRVPFALVCVLDDMYVYFALHFFFLFTHEVVFIKQIFPAHPDIPIPCLLEVLPTSGITT